MAELRLNLITREWVVIATERARQPEEFIQNRPKRNFPEYLDSCPFCPGNEQRNPFEVARYPFQGPWKIRVTPNKFPTFSPDGERTRSNEGLRHRVTAIGRHEVITESPVHNACMALMPAADVADVVRAYRDRFIDISRDPRVEHVIIFKNHGEHSGTTITHPHSQIIGSPVTPLQIRSRGEECMRYFDSTGECLFCATLRDEQADGRRMLLDSDHFTAFIPYAALSPFHIWIFPKRHCASFGTITDTEAADLGNHLKTVLSKIYHGLENPDFNFVIRSEHTKECGVEHFHWYLSIVPRVGSVSGFELGSGMYVNTSIPEKMAEFLRGVQVPD